MSKTLLISAALLGLSTAAFAQGVGQQGMSQSGGAQPAPAATAHDPDIRPGHVPGVGDSFPASRRASNIVPGDTHSPIAPRLPAPAGGPDVGPHTYLMDAQNALGAHQSGRAQEALERAETVMLQRSVPEEQASAPDQSAGVTQIAAARDALARGDLAGARSAVQQALTTISE